MKIKHIYLLVLMASAAISSFSFMQGWTFSCVIWAVNVLIYSHLYVMSED